MGPDQGCALRPLTDLFGLVSSLGQVRDVNAPLQKNLSAEEQARLTQERHGAIRVGKPEELRNLARMFRWLGMHAVGKGGASCRLLLLMCRDSDLGSFRADMATGFQGTMTCRRLACRSTPQLFVLSTPARYLRTPSEYSRACSDLT